MLVASVAVLVSAILLSRPEMPRDEATRYAEAIREVAKEQAIDPFTAVAIIHFETRFRPELVSPDGQDYGLGQVRARFVGACKDDADPVGAPSDECKAVKAGLLDGVANIRRMGFIIGANRDLCKEKTGTARTSQWLAGYQGYNDPERRKWCKPGPLTWKVIGYAKELAATFSKAPSKSKAAPKTAPASVSVSAPASVSVSAPAPASVSAPVSAPVSAKSKKPAPRSAAKPQKATERRGGVKAPSAAARRSPPAAPK
jgi:hypothetical protein